MNHDKYPIVYADISELESSTSQPSKRAASSNALNKLQKSIEDIGLQYPPLVLRKPTGEGYTIIDGHRRIAAMRNTHKKAGKALDQAPKIPVLVANGRPAELFSAVCGTTRPVSAVEWAEVHLKGGEVPSGPTRTCIKRLEETMGREFLETLVDHGKSPQIWNLANRIVKYTGLDEEKKKIVLRWLMAHKGATSEASAHITGENSSDTLRQCIENNTPLPAA